MNYFSRMYRVIAGFGMLGGLGSALVAGIGLYGVMAFQVRLRRREIGIRMAVGAARARIVRESVLRVVPGLLAGCGIAFAAVPLLRRPDSASAALPLVLISVVVAAILLVIGLGASAAPAIGAARLDPQDELRSD